MYIVQSHASERGEICTETVACFPCGSEQNIRLGSITVLLARYVE